MSTSLLPANKEFEDIYNRNVDTIYKVCFMYLKNKVDAEDATQTTFIKLFQNYKTFENFEHEKAWLIVTATNTCKNHFKTWWNKNTVLEELEIGSNDKQDETLKLVLNLPFKLKRVVYLYYYQGYNSIEISSLLNIRESTIRSQLQKAKILLKEMLGEAYEE